MHALQTLSRFRYESIAFLTGACVMVLEIVGARLIAPEFGSSIYVWTAMIGVILGALAVGYGLGGRLADKYAAPQLLGTLLFMAAIMVLLMGFFQQAVLERIAAQGFDLRLSALLAAVLLFALPSVLIGMVSPRLAKLKIESLETTGASIGRLEAAGAIGSIAGTFACGYFLLGTFGSRAIVFGVVVTLLITALIANPFQPRRRLFVMLAATVLVALATNGNPQGVLADVDSSYARYRVKTQPFGQYQANLLVTDSGSIQSVASPELPGQLLIGYTQQFQTAAIDFGDPRRILVIGGGAYTFPAHAAAVFPRAQVDVVEIDPELSDLSQRYFGYRPSPRLTEYSEDGRAYLNRNTTKYDLIYMDAFSELSPPFQLTTRETAGQLNASLTAGGAAVVNIVSRYTGKDSSYLQALAATYDREFEHVAIYPLDGATDLYDGRPNFMLYATDDARTLAALTRGRTNPPLPLNGGGMVLTDDFAPVERLTY